jgi:alpha-amylase/alpha-mannosidase (GH57 family)
MGMNRYVCVHCHFYQPPRENPWLEEVELEDSAYPYHDWNERITAECYAPNAASRILDTERRIINIENNYAKISFNFGPTLFSWMERHEPEVYRAIIEADRQSQERFSGHGSAIAQVYNHVIMPLANSREKRTQVTWGIRDFTCRFGRKPEGMWLAETAVDLETLDILSAHGIIFTILAPHQARRVRKKGEQEWKDVTGGTIDPKMPYQCRLPSGGTIVLFFYDSPVSKDVAFGDLLKSGENFATRLLGLFSKKEEPQLAHIATDGESYGHHHRFGDMALAYALHHIESRNSARLTNYAEYIENYPPACEVEIFENTSWSCAHGVERWKGDCGCNTGKHSGWNQRWRAPLREAMNWLRDNLERIYEREIASYVRDPWQARDDYIEVILERSVRNVGSFFSRHLIREPTRTERAKLIKLFEMQRHAMLMFTSCGWFFDEISGIETLQIMKHASSALQLAKEVSGEDLEPQYIKILERAPSNVPDLKNGAQVWEVFVRPNTTDLLSVGAHYAISSLFEEYPETIKIGCYTTKSEIYDMIEAGMQRLAVGKARVGSDITGEERAIGFAVMHLGDHNLIGGVREYMGDKPFTLMRQEIKNAFGKSDIPEVIRLMDKHFETHNYSLWHLFRDEQRKILNQILDSTLKEIEASFRQIYQRHYPVMQVMREMQIPLPKAFATATELLISTDIRRELKNEELDFERIEKLVEEAKRWSLELDKKSLGFFATQKINSLMQSFSQAPYKVALLETIENVFKALTALALQLDLWKAQNIYFSIGTQRYDEMEKKSDKGDTRAKKWLEHFNRLGEYLNVRCR